MLIQLTNGDWIDPKSVARISAGRTEGRRNESHAVIEERHREISLLCKRKPSSFEIAWPRK